MTSTTVAPGMRRLIHGPIRKVVTWAEARGKEVLQRPITPRMVSQWGKYLAPKMRNREMAEVGDAAICFWDGLSSGTPDMAARMLARGKPCEVIPWPRKKRGG